MNNDSKPTVVVTKSETSPEEQQPPQSDCGNDCRCDNQEKPQHEGQEQEHPKCPLSFEDKVALRRKFWHAHREERKARQKLRREKLEAKIEKAKERKAKLEKKKEKLQAKKEKIQEKEDKQRRKVKALKEKLKHQEKKEKRQRKREKLFREKIRERRRSWMLGGGNPAGHCGGGNDNDNKHCSGGWSEDECSRKWKKEGKGPHHFGGKHPHFGEGKEHHFGGKPHHHFGGKHHHFGEGKGGKCGKGKWKKAFKEGKGHCGGGKHAARLEKWRAYKAWKLAQQSTGADQPTTSSVAVSGVETQTFKVPEGKTGTISIQFQ